MNILLLYRPGSACDYHRVFMPFRYLPLENGEKIIFKPEDEMSMTQDFKWADLVIFNRHPTVDINMFIEMKKRYQFKVWVDIDDSWDLYPHHYLYKEWIEKKVGELILKSMNIADIVTVTNVRLLRKVRPINEKCVIIPNGLPFDHEQFKSRKTESSKLRYMYVGGPSHYHDLKTITTFLSMVSRQLKFIQQSSFTLAGYDPNYKELAIQQMNNMMSGAPGYTTRPALSLNTYMEHYNYCDIALSPLEDNTFNYYKSNLKIIEAGCMKTPIIATSVFPFLEDEEMKGDGIFFCSKPQEWYTMAKTLLDNKNLVISSGERLHEYVRGKYDLVKINELRRNLINSFK